MHLLSSLLVVVALFTLSATTHGFMGKRLIAVKAPLATPTMHRLVSISGGATALAPSQTTALFDLANKLKSVLLTSPNNLFNGMFISLLSVALLWKGIEITNNKNDSSIVKPPKVKSLQLRFLIVFWLMRMSDWLQGPYFYEVYSSKIIKNQVVSLDLVSKLFLIGFASTGIFGPWLGRLVDTVGRKAGTLAFALFYTLGALSTRSNSLLILSLGRLCGGLGTSLLFSAPEAWLVGEHEREGHDSKWLGQTFGWAYAGDSLIAITAGQLASMSATRSGPTGPFSLSVLFLAIGSFLTSILWNENTAKKIDSNGTESKKPTISDAVGLMLKDKRIMMVGAIQALFEGAMYIFVLQWPPALKSAIVSSNLFGSNPIVPFGKIFSCFMASCLIGSSAFSALSSKISTELMTSAMLVLAALSMGVSTLAGGNLYALIAAFFAFEACVGMYFPSIGTLRSKYIPDSHRSVIMNIFGMPLNLIVVSVFLSIQKLGVSGALKIATGALSIAAAASAALYQNSKKEN